MVQDEDWERRLYRMSYRRRRRVSKADLLQPTNHPSEDLVCFDYSFTDTWCVNHLAHFHSLLGNEHRAQERQNPFRAFTGCFCVESLAILPLRRPAFHVGSTCPDWKDFNMYRSLLIPTPPDLSYFSEWIFKQGLRRLIFSMVRSELEVCAVDHFLRVASFGVRPVFVSMIASFQENHFWLHCRRL